MNHLCFFLGGSSPTIPYTRAYMQTRGVAIADTPGEEVTHLLLPVPTKDCSIPTGLSRDVVIMGGNLAGIDLLQDPRYLAQNAAITAECAMQIAREHLPRVLDGIQVLVLGWGRIGKCLSARLLQSGAAVTVWARKETDRAMAEGLGCRAAADCDLTAGLLRYRLIFNTVPAMLLPADRQSYCRPDCVRIDLASQPGMAGCDVIVARGLPGKMAPETAGQLIAATALRLAMRKE